MASLNSIYIKLETLQALVKGVSAKGEKGISIDLSINNETNQYGQNISAYVSQTKEQRDAKKERYYIGNGKTFWTDGTINVAVKKENAITATKVEVEDDAPF